MKRNTKQICTLRSRIHIWATLLGTLCEKKHAIYIRTSLQAGFTHLSLTSLLRSRSVVFPGIPPARSISLALQASAASSLCRLLNPALTQPMPSYGHKVTLTLNSHRSRPNQSPHLLKQCVRRNNTQLIYSSACLRVLLEHAAVSCTAHSL